MSTVRIPSKPMTAAEYLAFERASEGRHEFIDGRLVAMAGASVAHNLIALALGAEARRQLRDTSCHAAVSDLRVRIGDTSDYVYPDVVIFCGEPETEDDRRDTLLNPVVVIEVLSPSTERHDRLVKFRLYRSIPSLKEIVFVRQDAAHVEVFSPGEEDSWSFREAHGLTERIALKSVPVTLELGEIYRGIELPPEPLLEERFAGEDRGGRG